MGRSVRFHQLVKLYKLADKLQIACLKNDIIHNFFDAVTDQPTLLPQMAAVCYIYENLVSSSPLRRLMVDWCAWGRSVNSYSDCYIKPTLSKCPEFAVDLAIALAERVGDSDKLSPLYGQARDYYEEVKDV